MSECLLTFDCPQDYTVFQQVDGFCDITVSGSADTAISGDIMLAIVREYNGTYVRRWEKAAVSGAGFSHTFQKIPAGGLYSVLSAVCSNGMPGDSGLCGAVVLHIGVGDVFVIAGQSNSAGFSKTPGCREPAAGIHMFRNRCRWDIASDPMNEKTDTAHTENAELFLPGQSPWLAFALALKRELGYPIGLIQTSVGGSPLSAWNPEENGILFRNMIRTVSMCGGRVKGVLWYQGETDAGGETETAGYLERFAGFVSAVRREMNAPLLPFFTVQLNKFLSCTDPDTDRRFAEIREAQRKAGKIPGVTVIPSLDLTLSDEIHNNSASNNALGERIAFTALGKIYGADYISSVPDISDAYVSPDGYAVLVFDGVSMYLVGRGIPTERSEFVFFDEKGEIPTESCEFAGDRIFFRLSRNPSGNVSVSCAPHSYSGYGVPFDRGTGIPVPGFVNFPCRLSDVREFRNN